MNCTRPALPPFPGHRPGLSACGGDKQAAQQPAADGNAAPAAAGAKVTAEVSGAGASFIFPLVSAVG